MAVYVDNFIQVDRKCIVPENTEHAQSNIYNDIKKNS